MNHIRHSIHIENSCSTHDFRQELTQYANQLVMNKLTAFQTVIFQSSDLLFYNDFEGSGTNEKCWRRTLKLSP